MADTTVSATTDRPGQDRNSLNAPDLIGPVTVGV
jgi:hypothetical protein